MSPLSSTFPAALMRLFEEELLVRVDAVVHEGRELVLYLLELVVGHRLGHRCKRTTRLRDCGQRTVRRGAEAQPCGGEQEGHAALCLCGERWRWFLWLAGAARERMNVWACLYAVLVQRAPSFEAWLHGEPAPRSSVLAAIDAEIPGGRALRASSKPREV